MIHLFAKLPHRHFLPWQSPSHPQLLPHQIVFVFQLGSASLKVLTCLELERPTQFFLHCFSDWQLPS